MNRKMVELTITEYETITDLLANAQKNIEKAANFDTRNSLGAASEQVEGARRMLEAAAEECNIEPLTTEHASAPITIHIHAPIANATDVEDLTRRIKALRGDV